VCAVDLAGNVSNGAVVTSRPAPEFDPQAYDCHGVWDLRPEWPDPIATEGRLREVNDLVARGFRCGSHGSFQCGHCGHAGIRYAALMARADVKEYIWVGETCLDARFTLEKAEFDQLRRQAKLDREAQRVKTTWLAACTRSPVLAYATYAENIQAGMEREAQHLGLNRDGFFGVDHLFAARVSWGLNTAHDIARKARRYGEATDRQLALLARIMRETEEKWAAYLADELAKKALPPAPPVPEGRQVFEGVVLSFKVVDGYFEGKSVIKMLVQADEGWRVYGTMPAALGYQTHQDAEGEWHSVEIVGVGDRVRFTATLKRSDRDHDFGFYSRPTSAEIVARRGGVR